MSAGSIAASITKRTRLSAFLLAVLCEVGAWPAFSQTSPIYAWTNFVGQPGGPGNADGTGSAARFNYPSSVAVDSAGNIFVADHYNHTIRKMSPAGVVTTLAGSAGTPGMDDGAGSTALFNGPSGVAVDSTGNVFVADSANCTIRKITPAGVVTTLAGDPSAWPPGSADGTGSAARFYNPCGVAVDSAGNVFVADAANNTIRKLTPAGVVTTLAGSAGASGTNDGTGSAARFNNPCGVAVDSTGNVFVADTYNETIRKVTSAGVVTTLAGCGWSDGSTDGISSAARFYWPSEIAVDGVGNLFVADQQNHTIREVSSIGVVTTLAGSAGAIGSTDGTGRAARFCYPSGVALDGTGNVFVADCNNCTIRKVTTVGEVTTLAGSAGASGTNDGMGNMARFSDSCGVAVDSAGNVSVADTDNHTIRKVTPAGVVQTLAGSAGFIGDADGTGSAAQFWYPRAVAADSAGNVFVADTYNHTIRKVTLAGNVTTLAGAAWSSGNVDGMGSAAQFNRPSGVAADSGGNVFVADFYNNTIRKVTSAGVVTTLAGSAVDYPGSADGTGSAARFNGPYGVAVDSAGNLFVADYYSSTIRKVTSTGRVTTLAGSAGSYGSADGTGSAAQFYGPRGVALDSAGNVFVADCYNNTIRKVSAAGVVTTIGNVASITGGADGLGRGANFVNPSGIAVDRSGTLYVVDCEENRIAKGTPLYPWLTAGFDGMHLQLSWPTNCLGWELQAQTNLTGSGLDTNWSPVAGSTTSTQMSIPIDPASSGMFYRLHSQSLWGHTRRDKCHVSR